MDETLYDPDDDCVYGEYTYEENGKTVKTLAQFWFNDLRFPISGDADSVLIMIGRYLEARREYKTDLGYNHPAFIKFAGVGADHPMGFLLQYLCDSKGLTEYGVSVSGSWLTDKGEEILGHFLKWEASRK